MWAQRSPPRLHESHVVNMAFFVTSWEMNWANCISILLAEVSTTRLEDTKKRETSLGLGRFLVDEAGKDKGPSAADLHTRDPMPSS